MDFGLSQEISEDIYDKMDVITRMSKGLEAYFKEKNYGEGIRSFTIGLICVHPKFDFFMKNRKKYTKSKKLLEYDVKLDHELLKNADNNKTQEIVCKSVLESLDIITKLKIPDFDNDQFRNDLELCFKTLTLS